MYCGLSAAGSYKIDFSGRVRYADSGLALLDAEYWQPKGCYFRIYRDVAGETDVSGNPPGWLFAPLILLDRWLVHPSQYAFGS